SNGRESPTGGSVDSQMRNVKPKYAWPSGGGRSRVRLPAALSICPTEVVPALAVQASIRPTATTTSELRGRIGADSHPEVTASTTDRGATTPLPRPAQGSFRNTGPGDCHITGAANVKRPRRWPAQPRFTERPTAATFQSRTVFPVVVARMRPL